MGFKMGWTAAAEDRAEGRELVVSPDVAAAKAQVFCSSIHRHD
jgi:hypothetical protein